MEQIRWQQPFSNLQKAFKKLERGLEIFDFQLYLEKRESLKKNVGTEKEDLLTSRIKTAQAGELKCPQDNPHCKRAQCFDLGQT